MLRTVMGTKNHLTIPMSGTGSAGMETCFVNLWSAATRYSSSSTAFSARG